ncbi:hypothetical protein GHT06_008857 [Daphnia sinensis]|uniref:CCHC-type domain-containing protein n=1 Tax=Daphnia sinensis TaxID=1820382 RepID=A0AAD5Q106_9CRUS|nr:hypothetical protein GHT06_008857 [Daphnia sinensis]
MASPPNSYRKNDHRKGREAITMLNQLQNFSGSPAVRFDRWIKLFDNVVAMSNWDNAEIISMLSTKMSGEAYDLLQNILESSDTYAYEDIKKLFQENYHGSEDIDFYQNHFDEIQRKPKENILNYAYRLKTLYTRAYPSTNQETPEEKITQLRLLRQKFLQGLEPELQNIVKHKTVSTFEELVSITQKYAKRVQSDIIEKDKRIFVNAVASTQNETAILQAIEKQSDHINSIASCLKLTTTEPARQETNTSPDWGDKIERLTDVITNLGSLMHSSMRQTSEIRQRIRNNINHSANQSRFGSFANPTPQNSFNRQGPTNGFRQPFRNTFGRFNENSSGQQPFQRNRPTENAVRCSNCGLTNHSIETCFRFLKRQTTQETPPTCYSCQQVGHLASFCPDKKNLIRPNENNVPADQGNE